MALCLSYHTLSFKAIAATKREVRHIHPNAYTDIEQSPITPSKRSRGKQHEDIADSDQESPSKKGKAGTPSKRGKGLGPIPTSYEEASEEDRMIIRMREKEGKGWAEIRQVIEDITGVKLGGTTLQNRYTRVKANFVVFEETDVCSCHTGSKWCYLLI